MPEKKALIITGNLVQDHDLYIRFTDCWKMGLRLILV